MHVVKSWCDSELGLQPFDAPEVHELVRLLQKQDGPLRHVLKDCIHGAVGDEKAMANHAAG